MSTTAKITGFAVALAAAFCIALGVGNLVGPVCRSASPGLTGGR
jgi:hypothetical protein